MVVTGKLTTSNYPGGVAAGGTGQNKYFVGDPLAASSQTTLDRAIGQPGQFLTVDTGAPQGALGAATHARSRNSKLTRHHAAATASEAVGATITTHRHARHASPPRWSPVAIGATYPNAGTFTATLPRVDLRKRGRHSTRDAVAHMSRARCSHPPTCPTSAAPGPIGGNTASTGVFTTVDATTVSTVNLNVVNPPWTKLMVQYAVNFVDMSKWTAHEQGGDARLRQYLLQNPLPIGATTPNGNLHHPQRHHLNVKIHRGCR